MVRRCAGVFGQRQRLLPKHILNVANAVRAQGDGMEQVRGLHENVDGEFKPVEGSARMFVLPNTLNRTEALARIRAWSAAANSDEGWTIPDLAVKILVIVHRMAANRLGFGGIYSAFNDKTSEAMKQGCRTVLAGQFDLFSVSRCRSLQR